MMVTGPWLDVAGIYSYGVLFIARLTLFKNRLWVLAHEEVNFWRLRP